MTSLQKNILFISYDGMTDPLGQSQVIPYLQGLAAEGYKIFLLSCEKKIPYIESKNNISKILSTSNIFWRPILYTKNPPVFSTLFDILKLRSAAKKIHTKYKIDMVHTRAGVPTLVGLWLKNKYGIKLLNDIREFYADSRVDGNMWNINNFLYKKVYQYFKQKEDEAIQKNDGIVCLTYAAKKIIQQWPAYKKNTPFEVIPCSADMDLFDANTITTSQQETLMQRLGITKNDFIISYLGSIGGWYLTTEMMNFCKALIDKKPTTKLLFISPHKHAEILQVANDAGIQPHQIIIQKANRKQVPLLLSLSKYSIFFIKPCYSKQSSSPTKHAEIMAMGKPVITNAGVGDVADIVEKYQSGIVVNSFSKNEIENAVNKICNDIEYSANDIRTGAIEFYSLTNAIEKYKSIYKLILN
jgi:glycosyltransferase involved in cell wall biosynthesis